MIRKLFFLLLFITCFANSVLIAQDTKVVILNLKNGYSVKGVIVEQSDQVVKIKTLDGEIYEYKTDEINNTTSAKSSTSPLIPNTRAEFPKVLKKGDKVISLGIGIGGKLPYSKSDNLIIPAFPISFEYLVLDNLLDGQIAIGCGGFIGYSASKQDPNIGYGYGKVINSRLIIGARGYAHYALVAKLDTYAGLLLGFKSDKTKFSESKNAEYYPNTKTTNGHVILNLFAGGRYFFNEKFAGMAELGWGVSILTIGVSMKL